MSSSVRFSPDMMMIMMMIHGIYYAGGHVSDIYYYDVPLKLTAVICLSEDNIK